jgi:hypothetical protein
MSVYPARLSTALLDYVFYLDGKVRSASTSAYARPMALLLMQTKASGANAVFARHIGLVCYSNAVIYSTFVDWFDQP